MRRRFTTKSRVTRGSIPKKMRDEIYRRDNYTCQFCKIGFDRRDLTIDHLVPLALGGLDDVTNYVTCCSPCNGRKANLPLAEFARLVNVQVEELPIHGDPVIDNDKLPIQIRMLRKSIFDRMRQGKLHIGGTSAQKKIEKRYRSEFWETELGQKLITEQPQLPGQVRIMIPEIMTIAKSQREYLLLIELAKSANTRNLIGTVLSRDDDIEGKVRSLANRNKNPRLEKRLNWAIRRFDKAARKEM